MQSKESAQMMLTYEDRLTRRLLRLNVVPRWQIVPTVRKQNVAEHTFGVLVLALVIAECCNLKPKKELVMFEALLHDSEEAVTGDIPNVAKRLGLIKSTDVKPWPTHEQMIVKLADLAEAYLFMSDERRLGNGVVDGILKDIRQLFDKYCEEFGVILHSQAPRVELKPEVFLEMISSMYGCHRHPGMEELIEAGKF